MEIDKPDTHYAPTTLFLLTQLMMKRLVLKLVMTSENDLLQL